MLQVTKCEGTYEHDGTTKNCPYAKYCYRFTPKELLLHPRFAMSPYQPNSSYKCSNLVYPPKISTEDMYKVLMGQYMSMILCMYSENKHVYLANRFRLKSAIRHLKEKI
jgi:hypothetical protein